MSRKAFCGHIIRILKSVDMTSLSKHADVRRTIEVTVSVIQERVDRGKHIKKTKEVTIQEEPNTTLSKFASHLNNALRLKGTIYIDGEFQDSTKQGNKILELRPDSRVEIKRTTSYREPPRYKVRVYSLLNSTKPLLLEDCFCFSDTTFGELRYVIQYLIGVPAHELIFKKRNGKRKERLYNTQKVLHQKANCQLVVMYKPNITKQHEFGAITRSGILWVSKIIRPRIWKDLAERALGLDVGDIDAIESNFRGDIKEQLIQVLLLWKGQKGEHATWNALANSSRLVDPSLPKKIMAICKLSV